MITLRCDGCCSGEFIGTTCYHVVSTEVFKAEDFKNMVCPIINEPMEWVEVEE